jgi:cytoskeletal protein CcmA (bactofilin family)
MASIIKIKRSNTSGSNPGVYNASTNPNGLVEGEIAVNLFDRKIYVGNSAGVSTIGGEDFRLTTQTAGDGAYIRLFGDSVLSSNNVLLNPGEGIDITRQANGSILVAAEDATTSNKGVASFDSADFSVSSGAVSLATDITVDGQLNVGENIVATGNVEVGGTLTIQGSSVYTGGIDVNGTAQLNALTVTSLTANSATTLKSTVNIQGAADLDSTLNVDGSSTLNGLTVTTLTANGAVNLKGATDIDSTLNVDGATTLNGVTVTTLQANSTLDVSGLASLDGGIDVDGAFTVADSTGNIDTTGTLNVDGSTTLNGLTATTFTANGAVNINDTTDASSTTTGSLIVDGGVGIAKKLYVGTDLRVSGDTIIDGNLTVEGGTTYLSTSTVYTDDGMFKLSANNAGDVTDTGIYAKYVVSGNSAVQYAGYFRDATDGEFKFYTGLDVEPTSTVDVSDTGYGLATINAVIDGGTY